MIRLGVTGGIGSGKSTVAALLARCAAGHILDADQVARSVTLPGGCAIPALTAEFGPGIVDGDGGMNRAWARERAFSDPAFRRRLESIIHPWVRGEFEQQESMLRSTGAKLLVYDIPLLVESKHWRQGLDAIVVADCLPGTQVLRVQQRNGLEASQVQAIIAAQAPRSLRLAAADFVLFNDAISLTQLEKLCQQVCTILGLHTLAKDSA